jgi:hypothetical protein
MLCLAALSSCSSRTAAPKEEAVADTLAELSAIVDTPFIIPFKFKQNKILLTGKIGNITLIFILDEMGDYTHINTDMAYKICDSNQNPMWTIEQDGFKSILCKKRVTIQLADFPYVIDTVQIVKDKYAHILPDNGVIGTSLFYDKIVKIDFDSLRIYLYKRLPPEYKDYIALPLTGSQHKVNDRKVRLRFEGVNQEQFTEELAVDLGGPHSFMNPDVREKIDINRMPEDSTDFASVLLSRAFLINKNIKAEFENSQTGELVELYQNSQGTIGMDVLKQFNLIFDYNGKQLYLKPNNNYKTFSKSDPPLKL